MTVSGRVPTAPGSREPSPAVSAASGFDPSRCKWCNDGCGWYTSYSGGFARWVPCNQCNYDGSLKRDPRAVPVSEREALDDLVEVAKHLNSWLGSIAETDMSEIVADGGITASMVVAQEASEQQRRLRRALQTVFDKRRDSDGSGEAGETRSGSTEGDSVGRQASPKDPQP